MRRSSQVLKEKTGYEFQCMGELEYYVIGKKQELFQTEDQRGYHESVPFTKFEEFRQESMKIMADCGCLIKYGHSEVGNFTVGDEIFEQNEIELLPTVMEDAADQLIIAKWILRTLAAKFELSVTFSPKITIGKAGSGMHIHTRIMKDGENIMLENGKLSDVAKKAIAGYLDIAPSLSAFGNTNPMSYFRLVPHQEAPTNICWGDRNRSTLVRVPLGWEMTKNMVGNANPQEKAPDTVKYPNKQTAELRSPDGSANVYLLIAGMCVAARHGLEMENALKYAEERYSAVNIFTDAIKGVEYKQLPTSCDEAADALEEQRAIYEKYNVFSPALIDGTKKMLKAYNDKNLRKEMDNKPQELFQLVQKYFHCG